MQRAAASSPSPSNTTSVPDTPPSSKRQKLSNGSHNSTPSSTPTPRTDAQAIEEALAAEEQKRNEALEREAARRGETKWYLSIQEPQSPAIKLPALRIVSAGFGALDSASAVQPDAASDDDDVARKGRPQMSGRRSFGKFNRKLEVCLNAQPLSARSRLLVAAEVTGS